MWSSLKTTSWRLIPMTCDSFVAEEDSFMPSHCTIHQLEEASNLTWKECSSCACAHIDEIFDGFSHQAVLSLSLSPILYTTTECISMTSYFLGALVTALGMLDDIHGLNCVPLSAKTSNHRFHKCHRTLKNMEIVPKAFILDLTLVPEEWTLLVFRWWKVGDSWGDSWGDSLGG